MSSLRAISALCRMGYYGVMDLRYLPPSEFLRAVVADEVPLAGSAFADENFRRLLTMMTDPDRGNRDWATLLVAQQDIDSLDVRKALMCAARDEDEAVRAEAILGLATRDPQAVLPFVRSALSSQSAMPAVFEAAAILADRSLVDDLLCFQDPSGDPYMDWLAAEALVACERRSGE